MGRTVINNSALESEHLEKKSWRKENDLRQVQDGDARTEGCENEEKENEYR